MSDHPAMSDGAALVLMVGPPGSGKSTWAGGRFRPEDVFSLDTFRRMCAGAELAQNATGPAKRMLHTLVEFRMRWRLTTVVDACNTRPAHRSPLVDAARTFGVPVIAVVMATPPVVCRARNAGRGAAPYPGANATPVPDEVVRQLAIEARETPPRIGEVDAILTINGAGRAILWEGSEDLGPLAEPWLADTLDAPARPRRVVDR